MNKLKRVPVKYIRDILKNKYEKNNIKIVQCNSKLHQKFDNCINLNEYLLFYL